MKVDHSGLLRAALAAVLLHALALQLWPSKVLQPAASQPRSHAGAVNTRSVAASAVGTLQTPTTDQARLAKPIFKQNTSIVHESIQSIASNFDGISTPAVTTNARAEPVRSSVWAAPIQLSYTVYNQRADMPMPARPAQAKLNWAHQNGNYDLRLEVERWFGSARSLHSTGQLSEQGINPSRYAERGRGGEQAAHLNPETKRITYSNNRPESALESGMQDRLSVLMQVSAWLAANPEQIQSAGLLRIPSTGVGGASHWEFAVENLDANDLPKQPPQSVTGVVTGAVIKLSSFERHEFDTRMELWFAQSQNWLPVMLRLTRANGDWMRLDLQALQAAASLNDR